MSEKEVYFHEYCQKCAYMSLEEAADPCNECLTQPINEDSHKPLYFKRMKKPNRKT